MYSMKKSTLLFLFTAMFAALFAQNPEVKPNADIRSVSFGGLRARSIGPAVMSGRVSDVEGVNSKPEVLYVGGANGGVWKSNSGGASFRPIFDDYAQGIGDIQVDQKHPDTVWVGTGEVWVRNSVGVGTGIYVSRNGGSTWEFKGLPKSERIGAIQINPNNSNELYVGVLGALWSDSQERGVYKSSDFGKTWERILYVDATTGCADLVMDPNDPSVLYAAMWEHRRRPDFFSSGGKGSALYKSTDGGKNWAKVTGGGFPASTLGRIAVAIAPSNSKTIYTSVETETTTEKGFYRSDDGGVTWKKTNADFNVTVRPFYFARIVVDPLNEKKVIKAGYQGIISEDGGQSFRSIGSGVHADMHCFWIDPKNTKRIILGCDGGAYISQDGGYLWKHCQDLPFAQFYHVSIDDEEPYNVYGGLQDNGSWYAPNENGGGIKNQDWMMSSYGDGFYVFRHPKNKNVVFSESQGGDLVRHNKVDGTLKEIKPVAKAGDPEYRWNWNTPISISPNNHNRMYLGSQYLFSSDDMGDTWKKLSPDLTTNDPKKQVKKSGGLSPDWSGAETNTTIVQIAESPLDVNQIWCGTDDGNLQVTSDGGKKWTNLTKNLTVPAGLWVSNIEPSHYDKNTCFVTVDGHRSGDFKPYVFKTSDAGNTWTALNTEGVESYAHCLIEDLVNRELLFLGTEMGLYISLDGGKSFKIFKNNIPKTAVVKMVIHPKEHDLVIATHGRGIFILDDLSALRLLTKEILEKEFHVFETKPKVYKFRNSTSMGFDGAGHFYGENPESNVQIIYYQKKRHTFGDLRIDIYDASGKLVQTAAGGKAAGINVAEISPLMPFPKQAPTTNQEALGRGAFPPSLPEGTYSFKIVKGKEEYPGSFDIKFADDCPFTPSERKLRYDATIRAYNLLNELGYYFYQHRAMHEQADKLSKDATLDKKLSKQLEDFASDVKKYNATLTTLDGDFYVAAGENLREELSKAYYKIAGYPGKPSEGSLEKLKYYEGEVSGKVKAKFEAYVSTMKTLNEALTKAAKQPLAIKTMDAFMKEK
jgi:photosystem II stability/assembly factor-like uncharacterized protein